MKKILAPLLLLAACAAHPPQDGLPRVYVDGRRVIAGHRHDDPTLRLDACGGCAAEFRRALREELRALAAQAAQQRAQAAPVNTTTTNGGPR